MSYKADKVFQALMKNVFAAEGGYLTPERARRLGDTGGATKYGISYNNNADYLKRFGILKEADMINLTREQAMQTAYDRYWLPSGGDAISDYDLAEIHYDAAFNCGVGQARRWLGALSRNPAHFEGGGKNKTLFLGLCLEYLAKRLRFYTSARNRKHFLEGWVNRLASVSEAMAKDDPVL